jgi:hypothetical protein
MAMGAGPDPGRSLMSRLKQASKARGRKQSAVTALGLAGALSLAGSASASTAPNDGVPTQKTASVMFADEEISDVSLATFYIFDKENVGPPGLKLAAKGGGGHGCGGHGCGGHARGGRGCAAHGCRGCGHGRGCRGCGIGGCAGCGGGCGGCCIWIGPLQVC